MWLKILFQWYRIAIYFISILSLESWQIHFVHFSYGHGSFSVNVCIFWSPTYPFFTFIYISPTTHPPQLVSVNCERHLIVKTKSKIQIQILLYDYFHIFLSFFTLEDFFCLKINFLQRLIALFCIASAAKLSRDEEGLCFFVVRQSEHPSPKSHIPI